MIREHLTEYAGLPVVDFLSEGAEEQYLREATWWARRNDREPPTTTPHRERMEKAMAAPDGVAWRLRVVEDPEEFTDHLARFVRDVDTTRIVALVIGDWGMYDDVEISSEGARDALIEHTDAFPGLRSLFFGDVTSEEAEISWIQQCDLAPLLAAYPRLTELTVRGVGGDAGFPDASTLRLQVPEHSVLRSLALQSGGLPGRVVRQVLSCGLPNLEGLELWLGVEEYGGNATTEDLAPLLSGDVFPRLRHLGLRNAKDTGLWLRALVEAPVLARLTTVDLSMGSLRGRDVESLLTAVPALAHLDRLDLHHHFLSEEETERVRAAFTAVGVTVDLSEREEPDSDDPDDEYAYYPAVTE